MQLLKRLPYYGVVALLVYMPLHVFVSQWLSLLTGGLEVWKLGKDVLLALVTLFVICMVFWQRRAERWYLTLLGIGAAYTLLHLLLFAVHYQDLYRESALVGLIYNIRLVCLVLLGASAAILYARVFAFRSIFKIVIGVSTVVALLGVLQYLLPKDLLTHFGYSLERGVRPMFFIDDNPAFPRIMSTLRDPNSLGAFLLVPLSALTLFVVRFKAYATKQRVLLAAVWLLHLLALYLTFSRSAWLAAAITMGLTVWWRFSSQFVRIVKRYWPVLAAGVVVLAAGLYILRDNTHIDGVLTHSTDAQVGELDSNEYHWLYVQRGVDGTLEQPLGHGPGTAGLASIRDPNGGLLTENYYVQIGYEVGVIGLALLLLLHIFLYVRIWRRHDMWTVVLLSAFWGYVVTNMLLHTWSNEAVATQWWLLAGIAAALPLAKEYPSISPKTSPRQKKRSSASPDASSH